MNNNDFTEISIDYFGSRIDSMTTIDELIETHKCKILSNLYYNHSIIILKGCDRYGYTISKCCKSSTNKLEWIK